MKHSNHVLPSAAKVLLWFIHKQTKRSSDESVYQKKQSGRLLAEIRKQNSLVAEDCSLNLY